MTDPKPMMTMRQVEEAASIAKKIRQHDELAEKYLAYPRIEFVNGARYVCSIGQMEMEESEQTLFQTQMREAATEFFQDRRELMCDQLRALGVEPSEPTKLERIACG